jgi:hypothetical protein
LSCTSRSQQHCSICTIVAFLHTCTKEISSQRTQRACRKRAKSEQRAFKHAPCATCCIDLYRLLLLPSVQHIRQKLHGKPSPQKRQRYKRA